MAVTAPTEATKLWDKELLATEAPCLEYAWSLMCWYTIRNNII